MLRPPALLQAAAIAALALGLGASEPRAQETMTFKPLPPESVASLERSHPTPGAIPSIQVHGRDRRGRPLDIKIDSGGVLVNVPGAVATVPSPPEPPEAPEAPGAQAHETTGDIVRFGNDIDVPVNQVVSGDVVSMGGSVRVDGKVRGSVTSMGGDVTLGPTARVDRDVVCFGGTLHEAAGSSVGGQRVTAPRVPGSHLLLPVLSVVGTGVRVATHLVAMLLILGIAFVFVKLAPGRTQRALDTIREEPAGSFLVGLLIWGLLIPSVVVLAIVVAILCITIIGIPLALAVLAGYAIFLLLAFIWGLVVGYALIGGHLHLRFKGGASDLMIAAFWGIIALYGLRIAGDLMHVVPVFGFVGGLIKVIVIGTTVALGTLGAGALVRAEYRERTVQTWWERSRPRRQRARAEDDFPPPPPASADTAPPPVPPAPEPPAAPVA